MEKIKKKKLKKNTLFIVCMLSFGLVQFAIFYFYVNFDSIMLSFKRFNFLTGEYDWIGFENISRQFNELINPTFGQLTKGFKNSLIFFLYNQSFALPLNILMSYFLFKKIKLAGFYRAVFYLPQIISVVVLINIYNFMLDTSFGPVNKILELLNLEHIIPSTGWTGSTMYAFSTVITYMIWTNMGYSILLICSAMSRIPTEVIESGRIEGVGMTRELVSIIIPMIMPTLTTVFLLNCTSIFTFFLPVKLITGGGPNGASSTIGFIITSNVEAQKLEDAASIGLIFTLFSAPILIGLNKIIKKFTQNIEY